MFDLSNYVTKWKYYDDSDNLVIGEMKYETGGVAIQKIVRLNLKKYSFLVDDNSEHKKQKVWIEMLLQQ